jgi:ribosomal protein S18 acetylase RimI-like enzyme
LHGRCRRSAGSEAATTEPSPASRPARQDEIDTATETVTLAFAADPVWSVALARPDGRVDHHRAYWRRFVESALDQGGLRFIGDAAAVSVWIPPGGTELSATALAALLEFNLESLGDAGGREMSQLYDRFEANHPTDPPHAYLSLLATHPAHRGKGIGQALLAEDLASWDAHGVPCYLESTNPANDHRYERAGFRRVGGFSAVRDSAPITTMWRAVGGAA